jgi:hypothetical protein
MTTRASTGTTATSESREPKLGADVHYVQSSGAHCNSAKLTSVPTFVQEDSETDEAFQLDVDLALCNVTVFWPSNAPQALNQVAHSALPVGNTYHYAEECRRGK